MYRMKGNRDSAGATASRVSVDLDPAVLATPDRQASRGHRWWFIAAGGGVLALAVGSSALAFAFLRSDGSAPAASAATEATAISAATTEPESPAARGLPPSPGPGTASPSISPATPTPAVSTAGAPPTSSPGAPSGSPTAPLVPAQSQRVRYVVQSGDACDLLRARFGFAPARWEDVIDAMATLSGRAGPNACAFSPGDVLCIPAPSDLDALPSLQRDDACLAAP